MRMEVRAFQMPRWIVPVLVLAALALVPFALMLALGFAVLGLGVSALRLMLPPAGPAQKEGPLREPTRSEKIGPGAVIDAEYEVKDAHKKE